jgi:hypothetical protein
MRQPNVRMRLKSGGKTGDMLVRPDQILAMGQDGMYAQKEIESIFP